MSEVDDFLAHYGVKGMKWGVRRDAGHEGERAKTKKIDKLDRKFNKDATSLGLTIKVHNAAAERSNRYDVDRINNKPEYKNADFNKPSPLRDKYMREHQDAYEANLHKAAQDLGTNASGTRKYKIVVADDGQSWDITTEEVQHAAETAMRVKLTLDRLGHITKLTPIEDDSLAHFGVKGMKWGTRKAEAQAARESTQSKDHAKVAGIRKKRVDEMSNAELKVLTERMNLEQQYKKLSPTKTAAGKKFAQDIVREVAKEQAKALAKKGLAKAGKAVVDFLVKP